MDPYLPKPYISLVSNEAWISGNPYGQPNTVKGLQNALALTTSQYPTPFRNSIGNTVSIISDACQQGRNSQNCSASCSGQSLYQTMFGDLETLHNCVVYPNVTTAINSKNYSASDKQNVEEAADRLGMGSPEFEAIAKQIPIDLKSCFVEYCRSTLEGCSDYFEGIYGGNPFDNATYDWRLYGGRGQGQYLINAICNSIPTQVNSDLGGVGVCKSPSRYRAPD